MLGLWTWWRTQYIISRDLSTWSVNFIWIESYRTVIIHAHIIPGHRGSSPCRTRVQSEDFKDCQFLVEFAQTFANVCSAYALQWIPVEACPWKSLWGGMRACWSRLESRGRRWQRIRWAPISSINWVTWPKPNCVKDFYELILTYQKQSSFNNFYLWYMLFMCSYCHLSKRKMLEKSPLKSIPTPRLHSQHKTGIYEWQACATTKPSDRIFTHWLNFTLKANLSLDDDSWRMDSKVRLIYSSIYIAELCIIRFAGWPENMSF